MKRPIFYANQEMHTATGYGLNDAELARLETARTLAAVREALRLIAFWR
ncbi:MAG: hypothetical protein ACR2K1_03420 [Saprospiraceae bacterium]